MSIEYPFNSDYADSGQYQNTTKGQNGPTSLTDPCQKEGSRASLITLLGDNNYISSQKLLLTDNFSKSSMY